jgi:hypothetical protein
LKKTGNVTLKIYSIGGKELLLLVNKKQSPGEYSVQFDGGGLPSGIYFYRLQTEDFVETKRMTLLK